MHLLLLVAPVVLSQQSQQPAQPPSPVARVVVEPAQPTVTVGDSLRLSGQALDSAGSPIAGATVRFFGGGFEGAVDQETGVVRGGSKGVLRVFALAMVPGRAPSRPTVVPVRIVPQPAARLVVNPSLTRLVVGQRLVLTAEVLAANNDVRDDAVTWASSAPTVVRVGADGVLEALAAGQATVTASAGGARATIAYTVAANAVRQIAIAGGKADTRTGDVVRFTAAPRDASGRAVANVTAQWTMAPLPPATGSGIIDQDGAFVAYEPGAYTVTAAIGAVSAQTVVHVRARDVRRQAHTVGRVPVSGMLTAEFWPHPNGRNAYLSTIGDRVYALDISNPAAPVVTDSVVVDARHINDVMSTADGKWAVITRENASSRRNGIVILDLADPAHPKVASEYTETVTGGVHSVFVYTQPTHGTHVYLTDDATGSMRVIDLNDPLKPREIARWQTRPSMMGNVLHDLEVRDGLAYLAYWNDGMIVLDVGNGMKGGSPSNPQLVTQLKYDLDAIYRRVEAEGGQGYIRGTHTVWRQGRYVFVGDEVFSATPQGVQPPGFALGRANGRLHVVDVSDLAKPRIVAWFEPRDGGVHNVWVAGDTLYVGDYQGGLRVVDVSGELRGDLLAQDREVAWVHTGDASGYVPNAAMAWGAFYHNGLVWVNDVFSGLWAVKIEPREPPRPPIP